MKQRVGLDMPMVGLVLKNGKTICGVPCGNWHDDYEGCEREGGASAPTPESGEGES